MGVAYMQVNSNYRQNIISYENMQKSNGTPTFAQYVTEKNEEGLYDFDHPLEPNRVISIEEQQALVKERQFYVSFLEKLEKLLTGNKEQNGTDLYGAINRGLLRSK